MIDDATPTVPSKPPMSERHGLWGWVSLAGMGALLVFLLFLYVGLHREGFQDRHPPGLNPDLTAVLDSAARQVRHDHLEGASRTLATARTVFEQLVAQQADAGEGEAAEAEEPGEGAGEDGGEEGLEEEDPAAAGDAAEAEPEPLFSAEKVFIATSLFDQAGEAIAAGDLEWLEGVVNSLNSTLSRERDVFFWDFYPLNLYEVMLWALAATLIRLIIDTGVALKKRKFETRELGSNLPLIVTVPILAVVIAFVISLVDLTLELGETQVKLDLSDVAVSILIGSLIGLAPNRAWEFTQKLADVFFERLGRLTGAGEGDDDEPGAQADAADGRSAGGEAAAEPREGPS